MNVKKMATFAMMVIMIAAIVALQAPALAEPADATLRIYGEDGLSAAFPYTDPEAPFDPQSDQAPPKDFVVFNPAYIQLTGLYASNVDTMMKAFTTQWFVPELVEPVGRVWLDDPNHYVSEDVVTEYTYMFVDKHDNPTYGTAQDAGGSYWTRFWLPIADNDDDQIGIDGCDVDFDGSDDWVVLRDVVSRPGGKDIDISTETFELVEGENLTFLDHMISVKNVEVISGTPALINIVVDIYYTGNDVPELIKPAFMAQIVPSEYVRTGRHTANNAAPTFYEPWYVKAIATGGDRAYVQVGRLLHTGETFFVDGAEYDVAMIYGPTEDSLKYITIRNPTPEHEDVNLEDLSVIKECVLDGELMPLLPPFNRVHDMIDDINIPDSVDDPCPIHYPDDSNILTAYDTVQKRRINNVDPLEIYFPCKDLEHRFDTNLLEILNETYGTATGPVDILFAMDLTGSMGGELDAMKSESKAVMNAVNVMIPDSRFGLVSYMDYNGTYTTTEIGSTPETYTALYGDAAGSGDYPYKLDEPLTTDISAVEAAINGLTLGWGADGPQDYPRIIYESYSDSDIGFRTDAVKILIMIGDAPPHDTDFDYDGDTNPDNTGGDPGRDELMGTDDDLDFQTVVADAADNGIVILAVHGTGYGVKAWEYMAEETDGAYFKLDNAAELPDVILDLITIILPVEESWKWLDIHTMPDFYKEFVYPELPDIDDGTGDFLLVSSWEAPNSCGARVMFAYDQATGEQDIYINNYEGYNALRLYGENESYDAAFPYTDPEAPFDPLSDEAPGKDFVTFNPAVVRMDGIFVSNIDSKMKIFARQWFIPEYLEPVGDVWLDNPNIYESEDVITEYTYMFIDKHYMPTYGTALSPDESYWTKFWLPVTDNDDAQIGIDSCDIDNNGVDDWIVLRDVFGTPKNIDISSETFELYEDEELTFLDHKIVVKNVEVISGSPPLINMVVDIYYLGNAAPELIEQNFMAQIVPGDYVRAGRHTANNAAATFYEPWYIKAIATGGDRAYVQVGRLLHTGETFFVGGAEYDVAMIYGPTEDSLKYITIRNPTPEHEDVNLEDLSVIKECVMDGELMPLLPPFNMVHEMVDNIGIPDGVDNPCPTYYPYGDGVVSAYDTVEERIISDVPALDIYFTHKDIEPRFDTNLLEILDEGHVEGWQWLDIHTMPDFYKEFVYPELPDIDDDDSDWLVTSSFTAPNSCDARVMFAYDAADGTGLYMNKAITPTPDTACDYYDNQGHGGNSDGVVDKPEAMNALWDYLLNTGPFSDGTFVKQDALDILWAYLLGGWCS
ncbi:MAG: vWA domain-containing protein [Euryarchaeota archaeon]|nr:vWA domain-containing protein [Euryarchaeota archaeon]